MAENFKPVFALKPETRLARITGATTDKSGGTLTNVQTLLTADTDGTKLTTLIFKFNGTSTAGSFLIWITDTAGANPRLYAEILYSAITSSATVASAGGSLVIPDLQLKAGQQVLVGATTVNTNIDVCASIGDFS